MQLLTLNLLQGEIRCNKVSVSECDVIIARDVTSPGDPLDDVAQGLQVDVTLGCERQQHE